MNQAAIHAAAQIRDHENPKFAQALGMLREFPVDIETFVSDPYYLGDQLNIWPSLMDDLKAMNPDIFCGEQPVWECLLGGATGTGKTTLSQATQAYQLYLLTCFHCPQDLFGLTRHTQIVVMMQSTSQGTTNRVIYRPFRDMFLAMPYTQENLEWDRQKESAINFTSNITVAPALANVKALLGQAIIGGILDEVNFMEVVEFSTRVSGPRGDGGKFDQAEEVYTTITRRRNSRYLTRGFSVGSFCVISSTRYRGDFLDRRMREAERNQETGVVSYRKKQYEVVPQDRFSGETFSLLVGTEDYPTKIIAPEDVEGRDYPVDAVIELVPVEYRTDFNRDPENALRDICGIATDTIQPFMANRNKIADALMEGIQLGLPKMVVKSNVDLQTDGGLTWNEPALVSIKDPGNPRFIHIDLSYAKDSCGVAVCKVLGFQNVVSEEKGRAVETLPKIAVEAALSITPSPTHHLDIGELREFLFQLSADYGFKIGGVSYDGFQSIESIQVWRKAGIVAEQISVDRTSEPYLYLRRLIYNDLIGIIGNDRLKTELMQLEYNKQKDKVDHPPRGSKDVADAVAGACYNIALSRQVRNAAGFYLAEGGERVRVRKRRERPARVKRPLRVNRPQ
jgi:hypothetical protein